MEVQLLNVQLVPLLWKFHIDFCFDVCSVSCLVIFCYFVNLVQDDSYQFCLLSQWKAQVHLMRQWKDQVHLMPEWKDQVHLTPQWKDQVHLMPQWKATKIINNMMMYLVSKYKCVEIYLFDIKCTILYTCHF